MGEANRQSAAECSRLEDELHRVRSSSEMDMLSEQQHAERIAELQRARIDALGRGQLVIESRRQQELAEVTRCNALTEEIAKMQKDTAIEEKRFLDESRRAS